jgi:hypothetical protein
MRKKISIEIEKEGEGKKAKVWEIQSAVDIPRVLTEVVNFLRKEL